MSDDAVIAYVKQGMASGKSQEDMARELALRGVTREQAERLKARIEQEQSKNNAVREAGAQEKNRRTSEDNTFVNPFEVDLIPEGRELGEYITEVRDSMKVEVFGQNIFTNRNLSFAPSTNIPTPKTYKIGPGDEVIIDIWGASQTTIMETISPDGSIVVQNFGLVYLNGKNIRPET